MKPTLEVLKLRAELAALEVQLAEQRIAYDALIWKARQIILAETPGTWGQFEPDRNSFIAQTDSLFP